MIGEIVVTAESEEKALEEILRRLQVVREAVAYEVRSELEGDFLPDARPEIEVRAWIRPEYVAEQAGERLRALLDKMTFQYELKTTIEGKMIRLEIDAGEDSSLLIGRDGDTLNSLQYLVTRMILRVGREAPLVVIDVSGYRRRQWRDLEKLVERAVGRARQTGNEIELDPMPSLERKYLHNFLSGFSDVKTFSRGEEPERYLVIVAD